jgi:hypothetical protein
MISINLKYQYKYLPTSAWNWNCYSLAMTEKPDMMTMKAIIRAKILTLI